MGTADKSKPAWNSLTMTKVKVCGLTREVDALLAAELGAAAAGFIFWQGSPRYVTPVAARAIVDMLPPDIAAIGVFVDASVQHVTDVAQAAGLSAVQLHGKETVELCRHIPYRVIKAVPIRDRTNLAAALDVPRDPWGAYDSTTGLGSLAVEFVTPAVSSPSQFTTRPEEADAAHQARMAASPHLKFVDQVHRGYFILDITPERAQADWYFVSTVTTRSDEQRFIRGFYTSAGSNHLREATRPIASRPDAPPLAP